MKQKCFTKWPRTLLGLCWCKGSDLFWDVQGVGGFFYRGCVFAFSVIWVVGTLGSSVRCLVIDKWLCFFFNLSVERTLEPSVPTLQNTHFRCVFLRSLFDGLLPSVVNSLRRSAKHTLTVCVFAFSPWLFACLQVAWGLLLGSTHCEWGFWINN